MAMTVSIGHFIKYNYKTENYAHIEIGLSKYIYMSIEWKSVKMLAQTSKSFAYCYEMAMKTKDDRASTERMKTTKKGTAKSKVFLWLVPAAQIGLIVI